MKAVCSALGLSWGHSRGQSQSLRLWTFCFRLEPGSPKGYSAGKNTAEVSSRPRAWVQHGSIPTLEPLWKVVGKGWGGGREGEECCLSFTFSPLVVRFFSLHFSFGVIGNSWILKWNACKIYLSSKTSSYPVQHNFPATQLTKSLFLQSRSASVLRGSVSLLPQPLPSWTRVIREAIVLYFLESKSPLSVRTRHRYFICH